MMSEAEIRLLQEEALMQWDKESNIDEKNRLQGVFMACSVILGAPISKYIAGAWVTAIKAGWKDQK